MLADLQELLELVHLASDPDFFLFVDNIKKQSQNYQTFSVY